jgi:hypothetical protein
LFDLINIGKIFSGIQRASTANPGPKADHLITIIP